MSARARNAARHLLATCLALAVAVPLAAQESDSDRRARQLEVFSRLLGETVQRHLESEVQTLQVRHDVAVEEGENVVVHVEAAPVVRLGQTPGAHGIYVPGHGMVFTLAAPPVAVLPRPLALRLAEPFAVYELRDRQGNAEWAGRVVEFRARMIQESLRELEALLERERTGDADPERTAELLREIEKFQQSVAGLQARVAPEAPPAPAREPAAPGEVATPPGAFEFYRGVVAEQRELGEQIEQQRAHVASAVREACVDALAQYGSLIKGLSDNDSISIVVMPASTWGRRESSQGNEQVITVRVRAIRELDAGSISLEDFRGQVVVTDRLGDPIGGEQP